MTKKNHVTANYAFSLPLEGRWLNSMHSAVQTFFDQHQINIIFTCSLPPFFPLQVFATFLQFFFSDFLISMKELPKMVLQNLCQIIGTKPILWDPYQKGSREALRLTYLNIQNRLYYTYGVTYLRKYLVHFFQFRILCDI